ncbi:MAG: SMC family ATPase [Asgard group archaeon]|nr:SMC family ATPase [Asgard group archaeon]
MEGSKIKTFEIIDIELENIKTYTYEKISFIQGNNVLIGENGAGKSTILESIYLALFGDTVTGRSFADMVRYGEKQGKIIIRFSVENSIYRIEDVIVKKDESRATQTQILVNQSLEETIAEGRNAVRIKMEELLGLDAITFISAIYASQGEIDKIVTAKDRERKKLFDRLFQIERFEKAWSNLANVEKTLNQNIQSMNNSISNLKSDIVILPEKRKELVKSKKELKNEKLEFKKIKSLFEEINQKYKALEKKIEEYNKKNTEKEILEKQEEELSNSINKTYKIIQETTKDEIECSLSSIKKHKNKTKSKLAKTETKIQTLQDQEQEIKLGLAELASQKQAENFIEISINEDKEELENEIIDFTSEITELTRNLEIWSDKIPELEDKTQQKIQDLKKQQSEFEKLKDEIIKIEIELKEKIKNVNLCDSKIVQKRLLLSRNAGENWREAIEVLSKINFDNDLQKLTARINESDLKHTELSKEKSVIDDGLKRIQDDLHYLNDLEGKEKCPTCNQNLSKETLKILTKSLQSDKTSYQDRRKELVKELKELTFIIKESKTNEKELRTKQQLYNQIDPHYTELLNLEKEKEILDEEKDNMEKLIQKLKVKFKPEKLNSLNEEIERNDNRIKSIQAVKKVYPKLVKIKEKIETENKKLDETKEKIAQLEIKFDVKNLEKIDKKINKLDQERSSLDVQFESLEDLFENLEKQKTNLTTYKKLLDEISEIETIEDFSNRDKIKEQNNELDKKLVAINSNIDNLAKKVIPPLIEFVDILVKKEKELGELENNLKSEEKKKIITSILRGLMRELPNQLLPNFIHRINRTATEILQSIIPGSDIQSIVLHDDYSLSIIRLGNQENITVLSGGETIIIALALRLAFAKEFSTLDLLILDEPTIFLDERRRGELVSVLERNRLVRQLFVVTHDPDFERISDKTHFITKLAGETRAKTADTEETIENIYTDLEL